MPVNVFPITNSCAKFTAELRVNGVLISTQTKNSGSVNVQTFEPGYSNNSEFADGSTVQITVTANSGTGSECVGTTTTVEIRTGTGPFSTTLRKTVSGGFTTDSYSWTLSSSEFHVVLQHTST